MMKYSRTAYAVHDTLTQALRVHSADDCAKLLAGVSERFDAFREAMPHALRGEWSAVVVLVNNWHTLVDDIMESAAGEAPKLVQRTAHGFAVVTAARRLSEEPIRYLHRLISDVPCSPLVARFGQDIGVGVVAIDAVRRLLPGFAPLNIEQSMGWPDLPTGTDLTRYRRLVDLAVRSMQPPLARVKELFALNNAELAQLFTVSRQAIDQWQKGGEVPASRRQKLANVLSVGELLERKLSPGRLPLVAHRRADAYGGLTMLEMMAADRDAELRELTERALDWSATA
ncbi:MAG: hypothetical protein ACYCOS_05360 [Sulfobacillus sp.]